MKFCRTIWCPFIFLDLLSTPKSGVKVDLWRFGRFHQNWPRIFTFESYSSRIGLKWPQQNSTQKKNKKFYFCVWTLSDRWSNVKNLQVNFSIFFLKFQIGLYKATYHNSYTNRKPWLCWLEKCCFNIFVMWCMFDKL
jgi:hypothetical protein